MIIRASEETQFVFRFFCCRSGAGIWLGCIYSHIGTRRYYKYKKRITASNTLVLTVSERAC